jgi:hypothetical protein
MIHYKLLFLLLKELNFFAFSLDIWFIASLFWIASDDFTKLFTIVIQLGAISLFYISNVSFRLGTLF